MMICVTYQLTVQIALFFEPAPFSSRGYSHKLKGPGLRYELGVSIGQGNIIWVHGPWPCGKFLDLRIFRIETKGAFDEEEKVVGDKGYGDEKCITPNNV